MIVDVSRLRLPSRRVFSFPPERRPCIPPPALARAFACCALAVLASTTLGPAPARAAASADTTAAPLLTQAEPAPEPAPLPVYVLPPVRTEADRIPPLPARPGSRTVLDRAWLDRLDPVGLPQALLPVAGLRVSTLGDGVTRTVSLRGLPADRIAILVDGRPLNTAQGGGVDLEPVDIEGLDRIEVSRGAMSALYGSHALGGAVSLEPRRDRAPTSSLRLAGGTEGRALLRARTGFATGRWAAEGSLRLDTASPQLDRQQAHAQGGGVQGRVAYHPTWAAALQTMIEHRRHLRDVPGSRQFPTPDARREDTFTQAALTARGVLAGGVPGSFDLDLSGFNAVRGFRDASHPHGAVDDRHENRRVRASASWRVGLGQGSVIARTEAARDQLVSTTDGDVARRQIAGAVYTEQSWNRWGVSAALRVDGIEGFAPHPTGRATVSRTLWRDVAHNAWVAARAGAGNAFRPPTFDDLFWPARATAAGNPDLQPEYAFDVDLGLEARAGDSRAQLGAFGSRVEDYIQWTPGPDGVWRPHNVGQARIRGLELDGSVSLAALSLPLRVDGAYTWLEATDGTGDPVTGGRELVGRARHTGFLEAAWPMGRWTVASGVRAVGRVPLTAANTKWQDGYTLLHARLRWQVTPALRLDLEGQNLLDTYYEDIRGYATPGREVLMGIRVTPQGDN